MLGVESFVSNVKKIWPNQLIKTSALNPRIIWMGILGLCLLLLGGFWDTQASKVAQNKTPAPVDQVATSHTYEEILEAKMTSVLSKIRGAGVVSVNITLESGNVQEPAKNIVKETKTVQEKDTTGGIRTTTETKESSQILLSKENGADRPVMVKEVKPTIKGVLIVAEGAYDSDVKANLTKAVEAGLGIPSYKITVLPQRK